MNVLLSDSLGDEIFLAKLKDIGDSQIWHINNTIQEMIKSKSKKDYQMDDLRDHHKTLEAVNLLLEYCGQPKMLPIAANVKVGCDVFGNPFTVKAKKK